jgi:2-oxoglutarate dehydrogenase E1 component
MISPSALMSGSAAFYEGLYDDYCRDPSSVDISWRVVFSLLDDFGARIPSADEGDGGLAGLLRARGHTIASLNPLGVGPRASAEDLCALQGMQALLTGADGPSLLSKLQGLYCGRLTLESAHIDDGPMRRRLQTVFEERERPDAVARSHALDLLIRAQSFERLLGSRYPTKKRFGAEGAEAIVPLMDRLIERAAKSGVREVLIGTMHRGRLNILANVLKKPLERLFAEIVGMHPMENISLPADVPYHLGYAGQLQSASGGVTVSLTPNPSHLEAVNAVALGRTRARQDASKEAAQVLCIVIHTDASVIGQGVVAETIQLSDVPGYRVGGTLNVIINNQIGFTTDPDEARTSRYCTGAWKAIDCPILHVNGDDIDEVLMAADLALTFRTEHARDVVVDLVCYRRNGHNEVDEPRFTQPLEYAQIDAHPTVRRIYEDLLVSEGEVAEGYGELVEQGSREEYEQALASALAAVAAAPKAHEPGDTPVVASCPDTGVDLDRLEKIVVSLANVPEEIVLDQKVARIVKQRTSGSIPWAMGEAMAFGSLLTEGYPVRLSGQDVARGAFSHRHFVLTDTRNGSSYVSLNHLAEGQARFEVFNSPLSEYAVLGFEYGYSLERPEALTVWEAQFGDFSNGAQIVLDQFVASAESKWGLRSNLVILLPHGLEGQGPEHSSARPERILQLAAGNNFELAHPTTPANYFHLLRRQILRRHRVPAIVLSPKSLLRLPAAVSPLAAFARDQSFHPVIVSAPRPPARVLICSGKIAYQLEEERDKRNALDTAIVRLERLYPLPEAELAALFGRWRNARYVWVQEEPQNYGAWNFLDRRLERILVRVGATYSSASCVSRPEQSSPAGSFHGDHESHQRELIVRAFGPHEAVLTRSAG